MKEVQAYKCEYCGKLYKVRGTCIRHEKYCRLNPENNHACFWCLNLFKNDDTDDGKLFYCPKVDKHLHSYVAEKRNLKCINTTERMPSSCEFQKLDYDDFDITHLEL